MNSDKTVAAEPSLTSQQIFRKRSFGEPLLPDDQEQVHRHVISVLVENHLGALNRVTSLFSARGFNLDSVTVGVSDEAHLSRMTLVTSGNDRIIEQVVRQLGNLVDTREVADLTNEPYVERELCLVKISYTSETRREVMDIVEIFRGNVVNITPSTLTVELTGPTTKINAFIGLAKPIGIVEVARSGSIAMRRNLVYEQPSGERATAAEDAQQVSS